MVWEFGSIVIDPALRQLRRNGREVVLQPRLFDLLLYFAANPGVLVTREALIRDVWGGVIVGDNAIAQAVSKLRRSLHTGNGSGPAIRTVWGRGYPSLRLLQFLCAAQLEVPLLLVGTHRDAELRRRPDAVRILDDVARVGVRVSLRGLGEEEVADFLSSGFGVQLDATTAHTVRAATDGNPFLLGELARAEAVDHGLDHLQDLTERRGLSERARELARRRLDLLSEAEQRLLRVASLIGQEFSVRSLARASNLPEDQVIEERPESEPTGRRRHALLRGAIAADATRATRHALRIPCCGRCA